jgi:hypothetical protein
MSGFRLKRTPVAAGFCMFPQSCDLRAEAAGSLKRMLEVVNAYTNRTCIRP